MEVVFTPEAKHLEKKMVFADSMKKHPENEAYVFSDGEAYTNFPLPDNDEHILLVHSGYPDPNTGLKRVYSFLQKCKEENRQVSVFFTYFPYQRQDQEFRTGELNEVEHIVQKLKDFYQVNTIYTVDPHFDETQYDVAAFSPVSEGVFENLLIDLDPFIIGCDAGAGSRYDIPSIDKIRNNEDEVQVDASDHKEEIENRHVILIDDMISSGTTMRKSVEEIALYSPDDITVYASHFLEDRADAQNISKINLIAKKMIFTNSIDHSFKNNIGYEIREKIVDIVDEHEEM